MSGRSRIDASVSRARTAFAWAVAAAATVGLTLPGLVVSILPGVRVTPHRMARLWARVCMWATGCPVMVEGLGATRREGPWVVMVNHQSALDIPLLMAALPADWRTVIWAKESLFRIPVLGWAMRMLGHMPIDRRNRRSAGPMLARTLERVREGRSVLLFPEETYSPDGALLPFQRGGFVLALKAGVPILPAGIRGTRHALPPRGRTIRPTALRLRFGPPIPTEGVPVADRSDLTQRTRRAILDLSTGPPGPKKAP